MLYSIFSILYSLTIPKLFIPKLFMPTFHTHLSYPNFPAVHEIRNVDANDKFVAAMKANFKDVKLVPRSKQAAGYRHEQVQILVAKRLRR